MNVVESQLTMPIVLALVATIWSCLLLALAVTRQAPRTANAMLVFAWMVASLAILAGTSAIGLAHQRAWTTAASITLGFVMYQLLWTWIPRASPNTATLARRASLLSAELDAFIREQQMPCDDEQPVTSDDRGAVWADGVINAAHYRRRFEDRVRAVHDEALAHGLNAAQFTALQKCPHDVMEMEAVGQALRQLADTLVSA